MNQQDNTQTKIKQHEPDAYGIIEDLIVHEDTAGDVNGGRPTGGDQQDYFHIKLTDTLTSS